MALSEYEFEISTDFTSLSQITDIKIEVLQQEIDNEPLITIPVHHISANIDDDSCMVYFDTALTTAEETKLVEIISNHTGLLAGGVDPEDVNDGDNVSDIQFGFGDSGNDYHIAFTSSSYKIGTQFIFRGTNIIGTPTGVQLIVKGEGKIRIYDRTNGLVLFEWDWFKENDWKICSIPIAEFDNPFPTEQAILELQAKEGWDGSNCYVSYFQITFSGLILNNPPDSYPYSGGDDDDDDDD